MSADAETIARDLGSARRSGDAGLCRCPCPGHGQGRGDKNPSLLIKNGNRAPLFTCFGGCDRADIADELRQRGHVDRMLKAVGRRLVTRMPPAPKNDPSSAAERLQIARGIAARKRPAEGTIVERYLREMRGYDRPIPATLGFLPATGRYPPAMIAFFGIAGEPGPGGLELPIDRTAGIHLTRLRADGRGKAGHPAKIMIGRSTGSPIVLAPPNDLLGLAIAEGIESALSIYQATGLGVWAAGSAGRMPALADVVPEYIDTVTIAGEADTAGRKGATELAHRLKALDIHTELRFLGGEEAQAA